MDSAEAYFAEDFVGAQGAFREAAAAADARVEWHAHSMEGPDGEPLSTDVARLGPSDARRMLVVVSGTHGIEGFAGSACQVGILKRGLELPPDTGFLLVHAINPYGFAWQRRVNEDNVDLNRNFVSHSGSYPANPIYEELANTLCPRTWDDATLVESERTMEAARRRHGAQEVLLAVSRGQYSHPNGLFFGGNAPTWSNHLLHHLVGRHLASARAVALIDIHTGLGPPGYGELIAETNDPTNFAVLKQWHGGELTSPEAGTSASGVLIGRLAASLAPAISATVLPVVVEFGTVPRDQVRLALRADNWLHHFGDVLSAPGRVIKKQIRDAFYLDDSDWKAKVFARCREIVARSLSGLAAFDIGDVDAAPSS